MERCAMAASAVYAGIVIAFHHVLGTLTDGSSSMKASWVIVATTIAAAQLDKYNRPIACEQGHSHRVEKFKR